MPIARTNSEIVLKDTIAALVRTALTKIPALADNDTDPGIERARDQQHGDYASNIALRLAKPAGMNPRALASLIVENLPAHECIESVDIAGPGFINFSLVSDAGYSVIAEVIKAGEAFGHAPAKSGPRHLVEYISANPTGPLHVGHGRLAAFGASVAQLLMAAGYPVAEEYYVNDAGRQMEILALSVLVRRLQARGEAIALPVAGYQGDYISDIAKACEDDFDNVTAKDIVGDIEIADSEESKDKFIDAAIGNAQKAMGTDRFSRLRRFALTEILNDIKNDLAEFGVVPDVWFSEESLSDDGSIDEALKRVDDHGLLYEKNGATWFRATKLGDEKDRVVVRDNGKKTYFASDIAYHYNKRQRGFEHLLDVLGSDHHGYVARIRAGLEAMGYEGECLDVSLIQFVSLYRNGEKVQMSTRAGKFVTLRELRDEVGNDAARFFYVMRSNDQHLDFDMDLAVSRSNENPVYYIQYAHARIASVFRQMEEKSLSYDQAAGLSNLELLVEQKEKGLATVISRFPETIVRAAEQRAPHLLANYLRELATQFHAMYNAVVFITDDAALRNARLTLISAAQQTLRNGLTILGVSAPEQM